MPRPHAGEAHLFDNNGMGDRWLSGYTHAEPNTELAQIERYVRTDLLTHRANNTSVAGLDGQHLRREL